MRQDIETGLPIPAQPFSWAVRGGDLVFTAQGPVLPDGSILQGDIGAQTQLTLENLATSLAATGGELDDVMQMQVYLLAAEDVAGMDEVFRAHFAPPYPNRCTLIVAGLVAPGMRIEISAIARIA